MFVRFITAAVRAVVSATRTMLPAIARMVAWALLYGLCALARGVRATTGWMVVTAAPLLLPWVYAAARWTLVDWHVSIPGVFGGLFGWWLASLARAEPAVTDRLFAAIGLPGVVLNVICAVVGAGMAIGTFSGLELRTPETDTEQPPPEGRER